MKWSTFACSLTEGDCWGGGGGREHKHCEAPHPDNDPPPVRRRVVCWSQEASTRQHNKSLVSGTMGAFRLCSDRRLVQWQTDREHSVTLTHVPFLFPSGALQALQLSSLTPQSTQWYYCSRRVDLGDQTPMQRHNLWHPPPPVICTVRHTGLCTCCTPPPPRSQDTYTHERASIALGHTTCTDVGHTPCADTGHTTLC